MDKGRPSLRKRSPPPEGSLYAKGPGAQSIRIEREGPEEVLRGITVISGKSFWNKGSSNGGLHLSRTA